MRTTEARLRAAGCRLAFAALLAGCGGQVVRGENLPESGDLSQDVPRDGGAGADGAVGPDGAVGADVEATVGDAGLASDTGVGATEGDATGAGVTDGGSTGCLGGEARCGSACVDTVIDPAHCGACGHACAVTDTCLNGNCLAACRSPRMPCGTQCVDPYTDPANCRACGHACSVGDTCVAGTCQSHCSPQTPCGDLCVDLNTDPADCGGCGHACAPGDGCRNGRCHAATDPSYTVAFDGGAAGEWIDACDRPGHQNLLPGVDDGSVQVPLPFPLRFWGRALAAGAPVTVCSNGWLSFDGTTSAALNGSIPSTAAPQAIVAPHWADLVLGPSGVCIATVGGAPTRRFVLEWSGANYYDSGGSLTFEAVIDEGTGVVTLLYQTMTNASRPTAGTDNFDGSDGIPFCGAGSTDCPFHSGDRLRLVPQH